VTLLLQDQPALERHILLKRLELGFGILVVPRDPGGYGPSKPLHTKLLEGFQPMQIYPPCFR
jgi:hypothetical protein